MDFTTNISKLYRYQTETVIGTYRYSTDTVIGTGQILLGTTSVLIGTLSVIGSITDTGTESLIGN